MWSVFAVAALVLGWSAPAALRPPTLRLGAAAPRASALRCAEDVGSLVVFVKGGEPTLAAVTAVETGKKVRLRALDGAGKELTLTRAHIKHVVPGAPDAQKPLLRLQAHEAEATRALSEETETLEAAWEMLVDEGERAVPLAELSELIFDSASSLACYATYRLLSSSDGKCLFKAAADGLSCSPRAAAEAERLRAQWEKEAAMANEHAALRERIDAAVGGRFDLAAEAAPVQEAIAAVMRLGCRPDLDAERSREQPEASDAAARAWLQSVGRKATAESARAFLVQIGLWSPHENLQLLALKVAVDFDPPLLEEAARLAETPPPDADAERRLDLRHLRAFAIDSTSTVEVDDALSVETLEGGQTRLWVHIADPTRFVALGSEIEQEARRRGSSIYLPTGTIPMMPMSLAAGPLSLRPDVESCALSIGVTLYSDGAIKQDEIVITPSLVKAERLSYEQVDDFLVSPDAFDEEGLSLLHQLAATSRNRLEYRIAGGSMESIAPTSLPDMIVKATSSDDAADGWDVSVSTGVSVRGASRGIVTEHMLLAGEAVAWFAAKNKLPMPYRAQSMDPEADEMDTSGQHDACRAWAAIRHMSPTRICKEPDWHEGLGLEAYVQATSPIRRFADMAVHYQLKAFLRGDDALPFPAPAEGGESSLELLAREGGKLARKLERSSNDYWLRVFLQRHVGERFDSVVLSPHFREEGRYKALILPLGAIVDVRSSTPLQISDRIELQPDRTGELTVV